MHFSPFNGVAYRGSRQSNRYSLPTELAYSVVYIWLQSNATTLDMLNHLES